MNVDWSNNTSSTEGTAIILGREGYTTARYVGGDSGHQEQFTFEFIKNT